MFQFNQHKDNFIPALLSETNPNETITINIICYGKNLTYLLKYIGTVTCHTDKKDNTVINKSVRSRIKIPEIQPVYLLYVLFFGAVFRNTCFGYNILCLKQYVNIVKQAYKS